MTPGDSACLDRERTLREVGGVTQLVNLMPPRSAYRSEARRKYSVRGCLKDYRHLDLEGPWNVRSGHFGSDGVTRMIQTRPVKQILAGLGAIALLTGYAPVWAQSEALREAVRTQRPDAVELARVEREACLQRQCAEAAALTLLHGYLLLSSGEPSQAWDVLSKAAPPAGLEAYHAYYLGQAAFYSGRRQDAAAQFERAMREGPRPLAERARGRLAETYLALGQWAQAAPLLEAVRPAPELLFARAQTRAAVGDARGQLQDLQTLVRGYPLHPLSERAEALLDEAGAGTLSFEDRIARARALVDARQLERTSAELARIRADRLARTPSARAKVALVRTLAAWASDDEVQAKAQLALAQRGDPQTAAEAAYLHARRALKRDNEEALGLMRRMEARYRRQPFADEAGFYLGWLPLQAGRLEEAVAAFDRFARHHPRSRRRDEVLWFKGFSLLRLQRYAEARGALDELTRQFPRSSLLPQARYWATRARQLDAAPPEAMARAYAELIALFPGNYYAALAAERLRELGLEVPEAFPDRPRDLAPAPSDLVKKAHALAAAGLFSDAGDLLELEMSQVRSAEDALRLGHALLRAGEYGSAHAIANRMLWPQAFGQRSGEALALFFPRAYRSAVESEAAAHAVDPHLLWAIMRRESAFRPDVRSHANAMGLMQIIPRTAAQIARHKALPEPSVEQLYAPALNVKLASWYVSELLKRFGHPVLAAAAYNAGPPAAARWLESGKDLPLDLFVEHISYRETRGYVKQVVADWLNYRQLYGDRQQQPRLELTLPPQNAGVDF